MPAGDVLAVKITIPANTPTVFQPASGVEYIILYVNCPGNVVDPYDYDGVNALNMKGASTADVLKPFLYYGSPANFIWETFRVPINNSVYIRFSAAAADTVVFLRGVRTK
jgi:hypothetical protein